MSEDDATNGLQRMSIDITKALYRKMAILGVNITSESFRILKATYYRNALDMIDGFENDARMNGLSFDRHSEESAVELFSGAIIEAGQAFVDTPSEKPFIPSWSRVQSAFPDMLDRLHEAVEKEMRRRIFRRYLMRKSTLIADFCIWSIKTTQNLATIN